MKESTQAGLARLFYLPFLHSRLCGLPKASMMSQARILLIASVSDLI